MKFFIGVLHIRTLIYYFVIENVVCLSRAAYDFLIFFHIVFFTQEGRPNATIEPPPPLSLDKP
jgi:hypothetical protein